jgi:LCP family protein required for cell wall assembly
LTSRTQATPAPSRAFLFSALWPGAGQFYLRQPRLGALLAVPPLLVLLPLVASVPRGSDGLIGYLVVPRNAAVLTIAIGLSLVTRLLSMALVARQVRSRATTAHRPLLISLVAIVVAGHLLAAYGTIGLFQVTSRVFSGRIDDQPAPAASASADPGIGVLPPAGSPPPAAARFSILLVGSDYGLGYNHSLTDTMMVVSVDPATDSVAMVSIPRDTARFEMYDGSEYSGKLNSLASHAANDPAKYPLGGSGTLAEEIGYLIGVPIDYIAYINLGGFQKAIDAVGGVDVTVARAINDDFYTFPDGKKGFHLSAGNHHLDGRLALAYVRSRYGPGDNDFTRARRQQELLLALKAQLLNPGAIPKLPTLLDEVSRLVTTNYPAEQVGGLIELSHRIDEDLITRVVLGPPYAIQPPGGGEYVLVPDMDRIAKWSIKTFGAASRYASR